MKKKLLTLLLSLTLVLTLTSCGNKADSADDTVAETNMEESIENSETGDLAETSVKTEETAAETSDAATTPEPTETSMPAETSTPEPTATPAPHEHAYAESITQEATCSLAGTKTFTCECGETYTEAIPMSSHTYGEYTYNNDATYEKDGTESAACSLCGAVDTKTKEGTMLVATPEPGIPQTSGLDTTIGSDLAWSGNTITSHNGITISTLNKFNNAGLYNPPSEYVSSYSWFGYFDEYADACDPSVQNVVDNLINIENTCSFQQGYTVWNDTIYMHFVTGGAAGELELRRHPSNGYYTIAINYDMSAGVGSEISVEDGRDSLLGLCAIISSTPSELEDAIYNNSYVEVAFTDSYVTIGDCQVKVDMNNTWQNHLVYIIKPN